MASILKVDTITGVATAGSIAVTGEGNSTTTNLQQGLVKSFVEGANHAAGAINGDTFNIASYVDYTTGVSEFNVTNAMGNADYPVMCSSQANHVYQSLAISTTVYRASTVGLGTSSLADGDNAAMITGDLA